MSRPPPNPSREIRKYLARANLLVTSRPIASIERNFAGVPRVNIVANPEDVLPYIQESLNQPVFLKHIQTDEALRDHIEQTLLQKSQGMFLLTKLHVDALRKGARYSKTMLSKAVQELPKQLDKIYSESLRRIASQDDEDSTLAKQVLAWIHLSYSFLPARTLQQALAKQRGLDPESEDDLIDVDLLVSVCAGLVILDDNSRIIRLVHFTVAEYFQRCFAEFYPDAATDVNRTCLRHALDSSCYKDLIDYQDSYGACEKSYHLLEETRETLWEKRKLHGELVPLSAHSLTHIGHYAHLAAGTPDKDDRKGRNPFGRASRTQHIIFHHHSLELHTIWAMILSHWTLRPPPSSEDLHLFAATLFGDVVDARKLLSGRISDAPSGLSESLVSDCLVWAAYRGNDEMVRVFLAAGAKPGNRKYVPIAPNPHTGDDFGYRPKPGLSFATKSARAMILERWPELDSKSQR